MNSFIREVHSTHVPVKGGAGLDVNSVGHYCARDHVQSARIRDDYLLVSCVEGAGTYQVGELQRRVGAGDVFVCFPGIPHQYRSDAATGWEIRWVHFQGKAAAALVARAGFHLTRPVLRIGPKLELDARFDELNRAVANATDAGVDEARRLLTQLLLGLCNQIRGAAHAQRGVERALECEPRSVDDMASACGLSKFHFTRKFRQATGISPWRYILSKRLLQAKDLLDDTDLSIKEVAVQVGFNDSNYFSRLFKRETGASPLQYREAESKRLPSHRP